MNPNTRDQPHFVWTWTPNGPSPQKWSELSYGQNNWRQKYVIEYWTISQDEFDHMSLNDLAKKHPCPPVHPDFIYG